MIRKLRGLEHFRFLHLLGWVSLFEVRITYSSLWACSLNFSILRCWVWFDTFVKVWGLLCKFTKVGVLAIYNLDACLAWKSEINVKTLMKMEPKDCNVIYGKCTNYIG